MSKAIWEIDYANQEILVTNDIKNLNLSEPYYSIDFFTEQHRKTPKVSIAINGKVVDEIIYDTGSAGYISLTENSLIFMDASLEKVEYFGYSAGVGVFGVNTNKTITSIIKIPLVELGQSKKLSVQNNIIMISNSSLLGNEFLKNYRTILDWNHNKIYLIKLGNLEKTSYKSFGFGTQLIDNNLLVTRTIPEISNLRVNDKILSINGQDFSDLNEESACDFFLNPEISANQTIEIVVLREGKEYTETLELLTLIE
jgi:hypothetical protein